MYFSQRLGKEVSVVTRKQLPGTKTPCSKYSEVQQAGNHKNEERIPPAAENLMGQRFQTDRLTSTGLADPFIYLIVRSPFKKYFSSVLSAWPQNDFPIIAYKQTFITDRLLAELRHCVKQYIASVWQISCL